MAGRSKKFYLFNCDNTYDLKIVEEFLLEVEDKYGFNISVERLYFGLPRMVEMCQTTLPELHMDFAIFVVHANESRLSINEDNAGIGYSRFYRALLEKTDNKVLIVIGGDSYYRGEDEEAWSVISRWAKRKVASQFRDEFLDGRQSFIFSWDKKHRPIHEAALQHYFDPGKKGYKFEYTPPKPLPKPIEPEVTRPAIKNLRQEPFVVEADTQALIAEDDEEPRRPRRRSFGDRPESQKSELRSGQLEEAGSYGAIRPGASGTLTNYPVGTMLLETRMRNGRISYKVGDVLQRKDEWRPSAKQELDLMEDWKSTPVAKVQFISAANGAVRYVVVKVTPGCCKRCWNCIVGCCKGCCTWLWNCIVACVLGLVHCLGLLWGWCGNQFRRLCR